MRDPSPATVFVVRAGNCLDDAAAVTLTDYAESCGAVVLCPCAKDSHIHIHVYKTPGNVAYCTFSSAVARIHQYNPLY